MTTTLLRGAFLSLLSLTVFVTSAAATCAWVVWANIETGSSGFADGVKWKAVGAYVTKAECERSRQDQVEDAESVGRCLPQKHRT